MKNILSKFALLGLSFGIFGAISAFAQADSCALKLEVLNFGGDDAEVKNAAATATNVKTRRVYRSAPKVEMPYFAALPQGEYEIIVSKAGFKRSKDRFEVACEDEKQGVLSDYIYMQAGNSEEIYNPPKVKLGIENTNPPAADENKSSGVESLPVGEEHPPDALPRILRDRKSVYKAVINGTAIKLPKPAYPPAARAVRASGTVRVLVTIDGEGNVISAEAVDGHPLLHVAALKAAQQAKFKQTLLAGKPVKVTGIITYNFVAN